MRTREEVKMYKVQIHNACSCVIKRALPELQEFSSKEEAEEEAKRIIEQMNTEFCKKHRFELKSEFGNFNIYTYANR